MLKQILLTLALISSHAQAGVLDDIKLTCLRWLGAETTTQVVVPGFPELAGLRDADGNLLSIESTVNGTQPTNHQLITIRQPGKKPILQFSVYNDSEKAVFNVKALIPSQAAPILSAMYIGIVSQQATKDIFAAAVAEILSLQYQYSTTLSIVASGNMVDKQMVLFPRFSFDFNTYASIFPIVRTTDLYETETENLKNQRVEIDFDPSQEAHINILSAYARVKISNGQILVGLWASHGVAVVVDFKGRKDPLLYSDYLTDLDEAVNSEDGKYRPLLDFAYQLGKVIRPQSQNIQLHFGFGATTNKYVDAEGTWNKIN